MSQSAEHYPVEQNIEREQTLVVVENSALPGETSENEHQYPAFTFSLERQQLVGRGALEVNDQTRTRVVLRTLANTCGAEFEELASLHSREKRLQRARSFLAQSVQVASGRTKKREVIDQRAALDEIRAGAANVKHPADQILTHIERNFGEALTKQQLHNLERDVLTVTHWPQLHAIYTRQITAQRASRRSK